MKLQENSYQYILSNDSPETVYESVVWHLWESPTSMIPNEAQVKEYIKIIELRDDVSNKFLQDCMKECKEWLKKPESCVVCKADLSEPYCCANVSCPFLPSIS